jgi:acetoin utilization deacetylase AcuC-like enzyme
MARRVALYDDPVFREHDAGAGHPERPQRLDAVRAGIRAAGLEGELRISKPRPASRAELAAVHSEGHIEQVASTEGRTVRFDPDTVASPRSYAAALLAAGAVAEATERVLDGDLDGAFCAVRPPGHHAEPARAMGFCLFNNVAVGAARALARGLRRVAVIDFDVHHGNGTQDAFYRDPRVLYVSSHAYPFYPGTGAVGEVGEGPGRGFTVNLPLPQGMGDGEYVRLYREVVRPVVRAFDPELVFVSVGFDPYRGDPLAGMEVTEAGFGALASVCVELAGGAAGGRSVFVLEGGYDLDGIARSSAAVVGAMLGRPAPLVSDRTSPRFDALLTAFRGHFAAYWPALAG